MRTSDETVLFYLNYVEQSFSSIKPTQTYLVEGSVVMKVISVNFVGSQNSK